MSRRPVSTDLPDTPEIGAAQVIRPGVFEVRFPFPTHSYVFRVQERLAPDDIIEHQVKERIFHLSTNSRTMATQPMSRDMRDELLRGTKMGI